jgi:hypothetical protein
MSSQLQQWNVAFAPLYAESCTRTGNKNFAPAATLRVQAVSTDLAAQRVCTRDMNPFDLFAPESRKIVDLSRRVAADPNFRKGFVFDCGIVPGLFIVVVACLDTSIRKEALQLLKDVIPRREGAWDSFVLAKAGEKTLQIEITQIESTCHHQSDS